MGDAFGVELPDFKRVRGGAGRFRGLRCIVTHLRGESLTRDNLTDLQLLRLDAMVAIHVDEQGLPREAEYASLCPPNGRGDLVEHHGSIAPSQLDFDFLEWIDELEERFSAAQKGLDSGGDGERALLVSVELAGDPGVNARAEEMHELARTAGVRVVDVVRQRRSRGDPRYLIGRGKMQDLVVRAWQQGANLVLFDRDLTPTQVRHIEDLVEERIVDRTQLILDIFAQHANTREGKLQVELAQLRYRLPRLSGRGESMSRLAGGIGGRGPGETKLEVDRRRVRDRIRKLEKSLEQVSRQRSSMRRRRGRAGLPVISIVGYTNAGKSTLLNRLTRTDSPAQDQLFSTVDPASRRLRFPRERDVIVTDTVGFIRDLPPDLIAGFRATLEEIEDASLLLHVADLASPHLEEQISAVRQLLADLGLDDRPEFLVLNKSDRVSPEDAREQEGELSGVAISATTGAGIQALLERLEPLLFASDSWDRERPWIQEGS